jgi:hypothetical protein
MVIEITLKIKTEERRVRALINLGAEANYIYRRVALQIDLPALEDRKTPLASPEGRKIYLYRDHLLRVDVTDMLGERQGADVRLMLCEFNLDRVDIILGYP